jgi:hypothetical protein
MSGNEIPSRKKGGSIEEPHVFPVVRVVPVADRINKRSEAERAAHKRFGVAALRPDLRRQLRFKIEVDIRIKFRRCGMLKVRTVDIRIERGYASDCGSEENRKGESAL